MLLSYQPHFDEPQSVQIRQPSWYITESAPQFSHLVPFALVPSGMYFLRALSTPFFHVLILSLSNCRPEISFTTCSTGMPCLNTPEISFA